MYKPVHVVGGGLAGSEAAWQLAAAGVPVMLHEMRPLRRTEAHQTGAFAELVCSNSFRSDDWASNAVGLLHEEMRRAGSLIMAAADKHKLPAGGALAVDREGFAGEVTRRLEDEPLVGIVREEIGALPPAGWDSVIVATGPLTSPALAQAVQSLTGEAELAFFDAIAPIVHRDTIDMSVCWLQSRYDKEGPGGGTADYINCPLDKAQYDAFIDALISGEKTTFKEWEASTPYFEGCLPIEVMAERGRETLAYGPMKPVGLTNPHRPERPYAVVQLRQDNALGSLWNMVGFQTKLKHAEQVRIVRTIPGGVCAARRAPSQHLPQQPSAARSELAAESRRPAPLCRTDHRGRGLCGVRRHRAACRPLCRRRTPRRVSLAAAAHHCARRAP